MLNSELVRQSSFCSSKRSSECDFRVGRSILGTVPSETEPQSFLWARLVRFTDLSSLEEDVLAIVGGLERISTSTRQGSLKL